MNRLGPFRLTAVISIVGLTMALLAPQSASAQPASGSLAVTSDDHYVGGQLLTFEGNIGVNAKRKFFLEAHLGRTGDSWNRLPESTRWTDSNGNFSFNYRAPSMFNIKYRARSKTLTTDPMNFKALSQDLTVEVEGGDAVAGRPFTLAVDTTPALARRPDTANLPVFPGRDLTLQRRGADGLWTDVEGVPTAKVQQDGMGYFRNVMVSQPGTVVYRVVQENWFEDGDRIGWVSSFPTFVDVRAAGTPRTTASTESTPEQESGSTTTRTTENGDVKTATAAEVYGWRPSLWDFAWVAGESLTSPPYRGRAKYKNSMWWLDASTGTGRAAKHNGGLELDSQRANIDSDADCLRNKLHDEAWECMSRGSQWVTLQNGARKFGRWEVRVRTKSSDTTEKDFRTLLELVPAKNPDCAGKTITFGNFAAHAKKMKFGVKSMRANKQWRKARKVGDIENKSLTVGVEVTKRHISWFLNGKVIGTVKGKAAVPRVPLTMRLTQQGRAQNEMNRTQAIFDWMRGFNLKRGKKVKGGASLNRRKYGGGC